MNIDIEKEMEVKRCALRMIESDEEIEEVKEFITQLDECQYINFFLEALCNESPFLFANGVFLFIEEVKILSELLGIGLSEKQSRILSNLIGNFKHQNRRAVPSCKLLALPNEIITSLIKLVTDEVVFIETHISYRNELVFYKSVYGLIEYGIIDYETYKKLVFATMCKTTTCANHNRETVEFNPMEDVEFNANLTLDDYAELCRIIFS